MRGLGLHAKRHRELKPCQEAPASDDSVCAARGWRTCARGAPAVEDLALRDGYHACLLSPATAFMVHHNRDSDSATSVEGSGDPVDGRRAGELGEEERLSAYMF